MGREARQGAIGLVIDRDYLEIGFPAGRNIPSLANRRARNGGNATWLRTLNKSPTSWEPGLPGRCLTSEAERSEPHASARIVETMQARLEPGQGRRPGRPTDASWVRHPKVPMSDATRHRLALLAEQSSTGGRKVSPMQIAARILEEALAEVPEH